MDREQLRSTLNAIKSCIRNRFPVMIRTPEVIGIYIPDALQMRAERNSDKLCYSVVVKDIRARSSVLSVGLEASDWQAMKRSEVIAFEKSESGR